MLAQASIIGFIPITDFQRAEAFYAGSLGLTVTDRDNPYALVLALADGTPHGTMIRCILVPAGTEPQPFTILGWEVPDIQAAVASLIATGIQLLRYPYFDQSPEGIWTAPNGDRIAWFKDPDGNTLSLSQHVPKPNA